MLSSVRVRVIELRIMGAILVGLWLATFALILFGYRPGGPVDLLVGLAAAGPILVALVAVRWPPVARSPRAFAALSWLAIGAMLMLVPSIAGLVSQLQGRGPQTLLPSAEAAYPWALALLATGVFAGVGLTRRRLGDRSPRRRRLWFGVVTGVAATLVVGTAFAAAAVYNDLSLGDRPAISSRFGPTDPSLEPPACDGAISVGATAVLTLSMDSTVDGVTTGQATLYGRRDGLDVRWEGYAAGNGTFGRNGFTRIGTEAWSLTPAVSWATVPEALAGGRDIDRQLLVVALTPAKRLVVEDRGLAYIEGARARHCRVALDGTTLSEAVPEVRLLVGSADLSRWRGDLDFWVFADGQLGQADGRANGPATELSDAGLTAQLRFRIIAVDRGDPVAIKRPD